MFFPDRHPEVLYILVSIKLHIGNDIDMGHCVCDVLYYNTGTWWNCDDATITKYSGYPKNVYDSSSIDNEQKKEFFLKKHGFFIVGDLAYNME